MLNEVYNRRILELAGGIPRLGRLEKPDASATAHSKLCGSTVTVDLKMDGDTVTDFAHEVKACALGQASSSIMASHVVGAKAMSADITKMVADDGGMHKAKTVGGCELTLKSEGGKVTVTDENGNVANVTIADVEQSNGVIHVIDKVLLPKM